MSQLTLISSSSRSLKALVQTALENELRSLEIGIRQTRKKLEVFETCHKMNTKDFLHRYENDEFDESLDFAEWIGESRLLERLEEKSRTLREVKFAD